MARTFHFRRAFSLIELLIVTAVIAILVAIAYPAFTGILERAKVTKDMNNLRQIGLATQTYLNDSDSLLFSPATPWSSQLELSRKYLSTWRILQSPFDKRASSELGDATTSISYGVNAKIYPGGTAMSVTKIIKPSAFILFAPAQTSAATVTFQGVATSGAPGVNVLGNAGVVTSTPGGAAIGGTFNNRTKINALFADLHCETMSWTAFTSTTANPGEPDQWTPYIPYP